jgi:hypothetical protein
LDVPPKMKVKGYMYPQMKKPVGMLLVSTSPLDVTQNRFDYYYRIKHITIYSGQFVVQWCYEVINEIKFVKTLNFECKNCFYFTG